MNKDITEDKKYCDRCGGEIGDIAILIWEDIWCRSCFKEKFDVDREEVKKVLMIEDFERFKQDFSGNKKLNKRFREKFGEKAQII